MNNKAIVAVWGSAKQGKTSTIKEITDEFKKYFPKAVFNYYVKSDDIKLIIEIGGKKIGIESQGDPKSRLPASLEEFAKEKCDIMICASRTRGETVKAVVKISRNFNYKLFWATNYRTNVEDNILHQELNGMSAKHIFELVLKLYEKL